MEPGRLNRRVELQSATETADTRGGIARTWATYATVWAEVAPLGGRELFYAQQVQSLVTHNIRMRYRTTLTAAHRIKYGTRIFGVLSVTHPGERHDETVASCVEQATGA